MVLEDKYNFKKRDFFRKFTDEYLDIVTLYTNYAVKRMAVAGKTLNRRQTLMLNFRMLDVVNKRYGKCEKLPSLHDIHVQLENDYNEFILKML